MKQNAKVYVMQDAGGSIKIGHSTTPSKRAKEVGRSVRVVFESPMLEHAEKIERLAHRVLALQGSHIRGEWFGATVGEAISAIKIAQRQAENVELPLGGKLKRHLLNGDVAPKKGVLVPVTIPHDLLGRLDAMRERQEATASRSSFIRAAVLHFVNHLDEAKRKDVS